MRIETAGGNRSACLVRVFFIGRLGHIPSPKLRTARKARAVACGGGWRSYRIRCMDRRLCCKGKTSQRGTFGLAPMYPAYLRSVCNAPGHHGYERAFDLISGQTPKGYSDPQYSIAPVRPVLHCVGLHSRRPRWEKDVRQAYGSLQDISLFG